jgi:VanZ family protein
VNSHRNEVVKAWLAAILWLILIAIESTAYLSANNTSRILYPLLHFLFGMDWTRFEYWHFYIRKTGHVFGYGMLSFLLFRAWRATLPAMTNAMWTMRWATIAVLGTAFVASLDEWHQSFIPSRTGSFRDVALDTCAAIAAQILIFLYWKSIGKSRNSLVPSNTDPDAGFNP